jgi:lipid-A-disaccharide synthase
VQAFSNSQLSKAPDGAFSMAMVAGETSGDLLAGLMMQGIRAQWPDANLYGIGGQQMQAQGFNALWPSDKLAVRGYVEVLRHYREIVGIRKQLKEKLLANPPQVFVGVDAPDFNLDLERDLKQAGIPTVHFVCPSVWAWRAERIEKIKQSVDHVLCIFPFETDLLHSHGIPATYVGHPLAQAIPMHVDTLKARHDLKLDPDPNRPVVALLPGSRESEITYLAERFFQAAILLGQQQSNLQFVLPAIPSMKARIEAIRDKVGATNVQVLKGQSHAALAACDVTLIASGTATLEAALFKKPMVIAYNMNWLSWQLMKRKKLQPWVGLPNILAQEFCVPELLQDQATPVNMSGAVLDWLRSTEKAQALVGRFETLHASLLRDTPTLAAHAIQTFVKA